MNRHQAHNHIQTILSHLHRRIIGQRDITQQLMACWLAEGHILITGAPGLGKTLLIKEFSHLLNIQFGRIQYTPDLLPSDITGADVLKIHKDTHQRHFEFVKGPLFANLVLADEINRASPRTQAAMLEAMQEGAVTYLGQRYPLPSPFMVCATQNPMESEGTYPLPEAQLDRFLMHALMDYPSERDECAILTQYHHPQSSEPCEQPPLDAARAAALIEHATTTPVSAELIELVCELVRGTRQPLAPAREDTTAPSFNAPVQFGSGPRGGLALIATAKSLALICGDHEVRWHHIKQLICPVLRHRISLHPSYARELNGTDGFLDALTQQLEANHNLRSQAAG